MAVCRLVTERNPRGAALVAQKAGITFLHEPLLPAPDACLGFARTPHDLVRADPNSAQQDDFSTPDVLLGGVAVVDERLQPLAVRR